MYQIEIKKGERSVYRNYAWNEDSLSDKEQLGEVVQDMVDSLESNELKECEDCGGTGVVDILGDSDGFEVDVVDLGKCGNCWGLGKIYPDQIKTNEPI